MRIGRLTIGGRVWPSFAMLKKSVLRGCFACRADIAPNARTEGSLKKAPYAANAGMPAESANCWVARFGPWMTLTRFAFAVAASHGRRRMARWSPLALSWEGRTLVLSGCYFSSKRGGTRSPALAKIARRQHGLSGEGHQHPGLLNRSDGRRKSDRCRQ